jgi:hypothetical protein
MEPQATLEHWMKRLQPAPPAELPRSDRLRKPRSARTRGGPRRSRSEAARNMLEMLRALAASENDVMSQVLPDGGAEPSGSSVSSCCREEVPAAAPSRPAVLATSPAPADLPGLRLLKAQILGPEPEDIELHCQYCGNIFRLHQGGASFEGKAACANCEQHLNRDVVLPAVGKNRPHLYKVCEVAAGPDHPKRPAWTRQGSRTPVHGPVTGDSEADADDADAVEQENLLEA